MRNLIFPDSRERMTRADTADAADGLQQIFSGVASL
jgi:hypothetical protein